MSERTGGVPLFVEEVTRLLLERGEQGGAQAIPPTLQQSLAARLDRLGSARETAQIGAVLGRGFSYALLQSVAGLDEGALQSALERLAEADILFVEGDGAQATYRFKHALIQDAAYDSLLKSRRQALHAPGCRNPARKRIARTRGDRPSFHRKPASTIWRSNGGARRATRRCAARPSRRRSPISARRSPWRTRRARRRDAATGGSAAPNQRLTQLHVAYGNALIAARGFGAAETTEAFAKARESAAGDKDAPERLAADYGLWAGSFVRGELPAMRAHAEAFLRDVGRGPIRPRPASPIASLGSLAGSPANIAKRGITWSARSPCSNPAATTIWPFALDRTPAPWRCITSRSHCGRWATSDARFPWSAALQARIADLTHVGTLAPGRMHAAMFDLMRGDRARVAPNAFELARLARELDLNLFGAFGVFLEGWATAASGASGSGLEGMRRGVELLREQNVLCFDGLLKMALAEAEAQAGDPDRARRHPRRSAGDVRPHRLSRVRSGTASGRAAKSC